MSILYIALLESFEFNPQKISFDQFVSTKVSIYPWIIIMKTQLGQ